MQSPIIVAVTNKEVRDHLSKMNAAIMGSENDPFYGAPVVLIVLADKDVRIKRIMARDALTKSEAKERINAQKDDSFYKERADSSA